MNANQVYGSLRKYVDDTLKGAGAIKGDKGDKGDTGEQGVQGEKGDTGASIDSAVVKNGHLVLIKDDDSEIDVGILPTSDYDDSELRTAITDKIDKASITTSISSSSTDNQVPSAKTIYNKFKTIEMNDYVIDLNDNESLSKFGIGTIDTLTSLLDISKRFGSHTRITIQHSAAANSQTLHNNSIIPIPYTGLIIMTIKNLRANATFISDIGVMFYASSANSYNSAWTKWSRVCSTNVADVPRTAIILENTEYFELASTNTSYYSVVNGICSAVLELKGIQSQSNNFNTSIATLPKPKETLYQSVIDRDMGDGKAVFRLIPEGKLGFVGKFTGNPRLYVSLTYQVAES